MYRSRDNPGGAIFTINDACQDGAVTNLKTGKYQWMTTSSSTQRPISPT